MSSNANDDEEEIVLLDEEEEQEASEEDAEDNYLDPPLPYPKSSRGEKVLNLQIRYVSA